ASSAGEAPWGGRPRARAKARPRPRPPRPASPGNIPPPPLPAGMAPVPAGNKLFLGTHGVGTQNYVCRPSGAGVAYVLFTPQATLFSEDGGQGITHHFSPNPPPKTPDPTTDPTGDAAGRLPL